MSSTPNQTPPDQELEKILEPFDFEGNFPLRAETMKALTAWSDRRVEAFAEIVLRKFQVEKPNNHSFLTYGITPHEIIQDALTGFKEQTK